MAIEDTVDDDVKPEPGRDKSAMANTMNADHDDYVYDYYGESYEETEPLLNFAGKWSAVMKLRFRMAVWNIYESNACRFVQQKPCADDIMYQLLPDEEESGVVVVQRETEQESTDCVRKAESSEPASAEPLASGNIDTTDQAKQHSRRASLKKRLSGLLRFGKKRVNKVFNKAKHHDEVEKRNEGQVRIDTPQLA